MKFIIISGGVLSGLGKGITAASIGLLLKTKGYKTTIMKCDMYLNIDAGTMNPVEHGEIFVTHDGVETDQDLGHYERFLGENLFRENYLTNGRIYKEVLEKERSLFYDGVCVEPYHHIPPEIISNWKKAAKKHKAEILIVELGGTVGEYEGLLFYEAARRIKLRSPKDVCFIHVGYLPAPASIGELKSKPIQQSISQLHSLGIQPDFIICRAEKEVDLKRKDKISLASNVSVENIISNPDVENVYKVPLVLQKQGLDRKIIKSLHLKSRKGKSLFLKKWKKSIDSSPKRKVKIAVVGKYQKTGDYLFSDSYVCVIEAIKHSARFLELKHEILWFDSSEFDNLSQKEIGDKLSGVNGIIVPQGWGSRGVEGKINAVQFARENKIPYLGLCFGMQMATVEFGRNVIGLKNANSQEVNPQTPYPVIHIIPNQADYLSKKQYGGTIRLGAWPCLIKKGTLLERVYRKYGSELDAPWYQINSQTAENQKPAKARLIFERHRHRYEFNNRYRKLYQEKGFIISGTSPDGDLVEAIELSDHPFFVGTQFHPEYLSHPLSPHPIFLSFIVSCIKNKK